MEVGIAPHSLCVLAHRAKRVCSRSREKKAHIAFNVGPHRCLGSHLARVELQILYEQMLARMPPFRLDPDRPSTFHGGHVIGVDTLWLRWDA